ncbi:unnamed protein product [Adineta steineri]|uniref:Uncharacterized protein n=3 Tax=Adineta steineri TaxID=433720 RepID=A0A814YAD6_9BILA|nr:unnamed protein product [Adineta steineri]
MTTTPSEFLKFAKDMGLNQEKTISLTPLSISNNNNGYNTLTGLSVLNNLCHLIEQIHTLKAENNRLRAHMELVNHVEKFLLKTEQNTKLIRHKEKKHVRSTTSIHIGEGTYDEDKSFTISPSNSLKIKKHDSPTLSMTSRERLGVDFIISHDDSSSMLHVDNDQSDLSSSNLPKWNKLRHALSFSRRRRKRSPTTPALNNIERIIPAISISLESDDDRLEDTKHHKKKKKKIRTTNSSRRDLNNDDTDEDAYAEFKNIHSERKNYRNYTENSLHSGLKTTSTSYLPINSGIIDDDTSYTRKQSKIAHYRNKIYSKLTTVKKQFSDQNSLLHPIVNTHSFAFDDIGSGLNHAILSTKLASAMTKSYQQKMREWETMQKSNFLVNYRRQSIVNKNELNNNSRKTSLISIINEAPNDSLIPSIEISNAEIEPNNLILSPILSPNQRSLILHQWREIMSEEIALRHYNEYLERKMQELKQLETDLKTLKAIIFSTNNQKNIFKHRSMTSVEQLDQDLLDQHSQIDLPQRCHSLQSLMNMPASWVLAVQSAAYSDILDGTSNKTTKRAIIFNKNFFNQLKQFKDERQRFEQDTIKDSHIFRNSKTNLSYEENSNEKRSNRPRTKIILTRACLRKFSYTSTSEIPQSFLSNTMIPLQTTISKLEKSSYIDLLSTPITNEQEFGLSASPSSSTMLNKRSKRSRFDFKKTLQRSKSMCMTQFNSWLQRRRQQHLSVPRRKSAIDPKTNKEMKLSPCSTPKLLGSPRLARIHQKIFKQQNPPPISPSASPIEIPLSESFMELPPASLSPFLDDSDEQFQKQEHPVRIYLPARTSPATRHVRITDVNIISDNNNIKTPPMSKITSPVILRKNLTSSIKTTARERRESFAAQSKSS